MAGDDWNEINSSFEMSGEWWVVHIDAMVAMTVAESFDCQISVFRFSWKEKILTEWIYANK